MSENLIFSKKNSDGWKTLGAIWKVLGTNDGRAIMGVILRDNEVKTSVILEKSGVPAPSFYPKLKLLADLGVLERKVEQDRSVAYSVTGLGKDIIRAGEQISAAFLKVPKRV